MNFIVLSSSNGTVFQAIINRIADGSLTAKCLGLISDSAKNGCVVKAKRAGIPVTILPPPLPPGEGEKTSKEEYDKKIHTTIFHMCHGERSRTMTQCRTSTPLSVTLGHTLQANLVIVC